MTYILCSEEGFIAGLLLDFISLVWYTFLNGKLSVCRKAHNSHKFSLHIKFANKTITIKLFGQICNRKVYCCSPQM